MVLEVFIIGCRGLIYIILIMGENICYKSHMEQNQSRCGKYVLVTSWLIWIDIFSPGQEFLINMDTPSFAISSVIQSFRII